VPAIEIFEVDRPVATVSATALKDVPTVSGGPESLLGVLEQGLIGGDQPVVLAGDSAAAGFDGPRIVTDGLRRRELNIGRMRDNVSQTLTADEKTRQGRVRSDLLPFDATGHQTVAAYQGVRTVRASSSESFADSFGPSDPSGLPFAALDGDRSTAWRTDPYQRTVGQWLEVVLETPQRVTEVTVDFADDLRIAAPVAAVRLTTDQGVVDRLVPTGPGAHKLSTLPGLTTTVRVTVLALQPGYEGGVALRELGLPGLAAQRGLRVPADVPAGAAAVYAFERAPQQRGSCYPGGGAVRCDQFLARSGEEPLGIDRFFTTTATGNYQLRLTARPRPGGTLPLNRKVSASASSVLTGDVTVGAHAAVDGDPATAWLAEPTDADPTLRLSWRSARRLDRIRLVVPTAPLAARPKQVFLRTAAGELAADVGTDGWVRFPALRTNRLDVTITSTEAVIADPRGNGWPAPAGVAEIEIPALAGLLKPAAASTPIAAPCGSGPTVEIDGVAYPTSVAGTLADVRAGRALKVTVCDDFVSESVPLAAGEHRLRTVPSAAYVAETATLARGRTAAVTTRPVESTRWEPTERSVTVGGGAESLLLVHENFNAGWTATLDGQQLRAVRVDGWQQAFVVPAGNGGAVALEFTPDRPYRIGLAAGAACILLVLLMALAPVRRRRPGPAGSPPAWMFCGVPGGGAWIVVPIMLLVVALGGVAGVALLLAALIVRQLRPGALPGLAFAAAGAGLTVAVGGRLLGHGQEWAYGAWVQVAMLAAVCAVAATAAPTAHRTRPATPQAAVPETAAPEIAAPEIAAPEIAASTTAPDKDSEEPGGSAQSNGGSGGPARAEPAPGDDEPVDLAVPRVPGGADRP
jgi:arabinofuranan 3-O-arabinosyltransferase